MKLNPDCVRDTMLALEEELQFERYGRTISFKEMNANKLIALMESKGYPSNDTAYTILQIFESKYIVTSKSSPLDDKKIYLDVGQILYITPAGHDFISSVYNKDVWIEKTKPILRAVGNVSLSIIEAVSKGISGSVIDRIMLNPPTDMP